MPYTKGEVTGLVTAAVEDYIEVRADGAQYPKKIWYGRQYQGPRVNQGFFGQFFFSTSPPKPGRQYGSSYLDGFQAVEPPPSNGSLPTQPAQNGPPPSEPKHFVGRDPGMADFWLATRWAWSLAAEVLVKTGKEPSVSAIAELADEIFQASYQRAIAGREYADSLEAGGTPPTSEEAS